MNEDAKKLLEAAAQNPDLPIVPMVSGEVADGENSGYWMGQWGAPFVDEYLIDRWGELRLRSDDDVFDTLEHCLSDEEFNALPEPEEECRPIYDALPWRKAILVHIDPLNS